MLLSSFAQRHLERRRTVEKQAWESDAFWRPIQFLIIQEKMKTCIDERATLGMAMQVENSFFDYCTVVDEKMHQIDEKRLVTAASQKSSKVH